MKQRSNSTHNNIHVVMTGGISMVLLIFVVLLLVSFASLSIAAAKADLRLSRRYEASADDYYAARNEEQEFLMQLDNALSGISSTQTGESAVDAGEDLQSLASQLSFTLTQQEGACQIEKTFPAGDNAELVLRAALFPSDEVSYRILSEKITSTQSFDYEPALNLIH